MSSSDSPDVTGPLGPVATLEICEIRWTRGEGWVRSSERGGQAGRGTSSFPRAKNLPAPPRPHPGDLEIRPRNNTPAAAAPWGGGGAGSRTRRSLPARRAISPRAGVVRRDARVAGGGARDRPRVDGEAPRAVVSKMPAYFPSRSRGTVAKWHSVGGARARWRSRRRAGGRTHREVTLAGANRGARGESLRIEPGEGWEAGRLDRGRRRGGGNPPPGCPMLGASEEKRVPTVLDRATATARTRPSRSRPGRKSIERVWTPIARRARRAAADRARVLPPRFAPRQSSDDVAEASIHRGWDDAGAHLLRDDIGALRRLVGGDTEGGERAREGRSRGHGFGRLRVLRRVREASMQTPSAAHAGISALLAARGRSASQVDS